MVQAEPWLPEETEAEVLTTRAGGGSIHRRKAALSAGDITVTWVLRVSLTSSPGVVMAAFLLPLQTALGDTCCSGPVQGLF